MKFYLNEQIHPSAVERLRQHGEIVSNFDAPEDIDAIIVRTDTVTRALMQKAKKLKVIGKHGVGYDNIDIAAAKELGIRVVYTPLANVNSVAELIIALIFCTSRNIAAANEGIRKSRYCRVSPPELKGIEVKGKTLGLVGLGNVARTVAADMQAGMQMKIVGYDPYMTAERCGELGIEKFDCLEEMLARCDYVSISVPLTDSTRNLIDEPQLKCLSPSAILVNTARGGIVNEAALYRALKDGRLRAAACDVFQHEPPTRDNPLTELDNFIATPHIGADTEEALHRTGMMIVEEILTVLEGKKPRYPVV